MRSGLPQDGEVFEPWRFVLAAVEQLAAVRDVVGEGDEKTDCEDHSIEQLPTGPLPSFGLRQCKARKRSPGDWVLWDSRVR